LLQQHTIEDGAVKSLKVLELWCGRRQAKRPIIQTRRKAVQPRAQAAELRLHRVERNSGNRTECAQAKHIQPAHSFVVERDAVDGLGREERGFLSTWDSDDCASTRHVRSALSHKARPRQANRRLKPQTGTDLLRELLRNAEYLLQPCASKI
jgi:hypothetical protein